MYSSAITNNYIKLLSAMKYFAWYFKYFRTKQVKINISVAFCI